MACNAISYQSARIEDAAIVKLLAQVDKNDLSQKLVTFLQAAYPTAQVFPRYQTSVATGAYLYLPGGTVEITVWNERGVEVTAYSKALADQVRDRLAPFIRAVASQQLQNQVARWAANNATVTKAERSSTGALTLKVRL